MTVRYMVAGFTGSGTARDPFVPDVEVADADGWSIVDLSDDPTAPDVCLVAVEYENRASSIPRRKGELDAIGIVDLGDGNGVLSRADTVTARAAMGLSRAGGRATPGEMVFEKLAGKLQPERDGVKRIRARGRILYEEAG